MYSTAARLFLRSAAARTICSARLSAGAKTKPNRNPFRVSNQNPVSQLFLRSPVEMSCCIESLLPYHTATASALLTSMLSVSRRSYGWTSEGQEKTR